MRAESCLPLAHLNDALLQHIQGNISFFSGHHQRRTDPDRARPAAEEQDAALVDADQHSRAMSASPNRKQPKTTYHIKYVTSLSSLL